MRASEGDAIGSVVDDQQPRQPFPHDLTLRLLVAAGIQVERVTVRRLIDGVFYAELTIQQGEEQHALDARLSDALAVAVRASAPIYISRAVFDATSFDPRDRQQEREAAVRATERYRAEYPRPVPAPPVPVPVPVDPPLRQRVEACLERLLLSSGGHSALLLHQSGTAIAWRGALVPEYVAPYAQAQISADGDQRHALAMQLIGKTEAEADDLDVLFRFGQVAEHYTLELIISLEREEGAEDQMNEHFRQALAELQTLLPIQPAAP
jgi:bifunctional DNase/RNase